MVHRDLPKRRTAATRRTWGAAALCLLAGAAFAWQLMAGSGEAPTAASSLAGLEDRQRQAPVDATSFALAPAGDYMEIVERPLFSRSRRPVEGNQIKLKGTGKDGYGDGSAAQISLDGIVLTQGRRVVLLHLNGDPKVIQVTEGQQAGGWLIESISAEAVLLRRGDSLAEVVLDYKRRGEGSAARGDRPVRGKPVRAVQQSDVDSDDEANEPMSSPPVGEDDQSFSGHEEFSGDEGFSDEEAVE